ncbi:MAG: NapC/NirT family cytochrome c, partial [Pseudolabrys sp.]
WAAHRVKLTEEAQARMRRWDSVTCRGCHDANAISPKSEDGRTSHATLKQGGVTCVDCHTNLVHPPAAATKD